MVNRTKQLHRTYNAAQVITMKNLDFSCDIWYESLNVDFFKKKP